MRVHSPEEGTAGPSRRERETLTVDYGKGGVAEVDRIASELRKAIGAVIGTKAITRSFVARFAVRILGEAIKRNELLKLMRLASEGAGKSFPPPSAT